MPALLIALFVLAGVVGGFAAANLSAWWFAGRDPIAGRFGLLCTAFTAYVALQVVVLTAGDLPTTATALRWQGVAMGGCLVGYVWFGSALMGHPFDAFDRVVVATYAALAAWSLASPSGYWFATLTALDVNTYDGVNLYHPRGPLAWTYGVSIAIQYPLFLREVARGGRHFLRGHRADGLLWSLGAATMVGAATHDHLVDLSWLPPPYVGEYPFPILIVAMAVSNVVRRAEQQHHLTLLQRSLARSEVRLRDLYDSASDAVFIHDGETGVILDVNRTMEELYGYTAAECRELTVSDLSGTEYTQELAQARLRDAPARGKITFPWVARRRDGSEFPVEVTLKRTELAGRPSVVATVRDMTAHHAVSAALEREQAFLRESEARFRALFDAAGDAIFLVSAGRIVDANAMALRLFGGTHRDDIVGRLPHELSPERQPDGSDSCDASRRRVDAAQAGNPQRFEWLHRRLDGSAFQAEVSLTAVELGGVPHVQAIIRDVTVRRQLEERLRQAQRLEAIGHLAGGVAHDFNNLLTPILGNVQMLLEDLPAGAAQREELGEVLSAAERAQRLTRQLLTFSRRAPLEVVTFDLRELLGGMRPLLRRLLREDVALHIGSEGAPVVVLADRSQIEQVVLNLAVNARDAMPQGGNLTVSAGLQTLADDLAAELACAPGDYAVLSVADTGLGIGEDDQRRIFEPFFTTKPLGHGTGLGLSTVFGIARQHGGAVQLVSARGAGATFRVFLPVAAGPVPDAAFTPQEPATRSGSEVVLVVEDEAAVREFICRMLTQRGYSVHAAASPADALVRFERLEPPPALLVTDVVMPGMNGRQLVEQLKVSRPDLRVLFISGYAGDVLSEQGVFEAGASLLAKPFTGRDLLAKIRQVMDADG